MICEMIDCICKPAISPDGWLSFIGELIGAAATIAAVILTIKSDNKRERKRRILESKPWISTDNILINNSTDYKELNDGRNLFIFKNGEHFGGSYKAPSKMLNDNYTYNQNECVVKYIFKNSGGNSATAINCMINNEPIMPRFTIAKNEEKVLILILPKTDNDRTIYKVTFEYGDIYYEEFYKQNETFVIEKDSNGITLAQSNEDLISEPQKIEKPKSEEN